MNYRHSYHAGNFADVIKHVVVARIVTYLKRKPKAFRVIDTHAGIGRYDLAGDEALKTDEAQEGISRVWQAQFSETTKDLLAPYLDVVAALNDEDRETLPRFYPGSPLLVRHLMRSQDRLIANELHPTDHQELAQVFARDAQVKVMKLDAWTAVKSLLPAPEKRGLVLIDPPFEVSGEFERLTQGLQDAVKRFATGTFVLWYPIKDPRDAARFHRGLSESGVKNILAIELLRHGAQRRDVLNGTGLIVCNPPFTLKAELEQMLPELVQVLSTAPGATASARWIVTES